MGISAIALLRIKSLAALAGPGFRADALEDAVLLHTGASFGCEPEMLSRVVRELIGDALDVEHDDPRGIFFVPDVVSPVARTYQGVIAEVGEGGVWGPRTTTPAPDFSTSTADAAGLGALLGSIMQQIPESILQSVGDASRAQPGALEAASARLRSLMDNPRETLSDTLARGSAAATEHAGGQDPAANASPDSRPEQPSPASFADLASMLEGTGLDLAAMQQLVGQVESALARDPAQTAALVERLFGSGVALDTASDEYDDEDGDDEEPAGATSKPPGSAKG